MRGEGNRRRTASGERPAAAKRPLGRKAPGKGDRKRAHEQSDGDGNGRSGNAAEVPDVEMVDHGLFRYSSSIVIAQIDKIGISVVMSNKQFLQDLHLVGKPGIAGLLMSGFLVSYAFFHFFWAYWIKKFGPRASGILGITIWALTFLLSAIAQTATQLILARALLGVGEAVVYPMCNAFVANWFPVRERGRATSIWMTGTQFGGAVCGALIVGLIAPRHLAHGLLRPLRHESADTPAPAHFLHAGPPPPVAAGQTG